MTNPDLTIGTAAFWLGLGALIGNWMRGRRDDREQRWLREFRARYARGSGVPPIGDPDGGRRGD